MEIPRLVRILLCDILYGMPATIIYFALCWKLTSSRKAEDEEDDSILALKQVKTKALIVNTDIVPSARLSRFNKGSIMGVIRNVAPKYTQSQSFAFGGERSKRALKSCIETRICRSEAASTTSPIFTS